MSDLKKKLEELASPGTSGSDVRATNTPENWRPRSEVGADGGFAISSPHPIGNTPGAEDIMREHNLDPEEWIVTSARHGKWQTFSGEWLESSRINIGWAAVTNSISWIAVAFFLVIFFWTPPHFWALAIKYKDDYEAASIPMLPVIAARTIVVKNMWFYTVAMITSSIALIYLADLQWWAMVITVGLGLVFAFQLLQLKENSENYNSVAAKIFHWSITYLTLFSALLVVAQLLKA